MTKKIPSWWGNKKHYRICDVMEGLCSIPDEVINCVVTSPPYWLHRNYGVDEQIGIEENMEEYIEKMVNIFKEIKRVLRDDGTVWLNIGDAYSNKSKDGLKPKDLIGIPWRLAFALQQDGWYLRSDIIWSKSNSMPESVIDRPYKSYEHIFLLTKNSNYYYDFESLRYNGKRNVWNIPTTKSLGEVNHIAMFPMKLPELCIKAGSSHKGVCPKCGAPWKEILKKERKNGRPPTNCGNMDNNGKTRTTVGLNVPAKYKEVKIIKIGWEPTCSCNIKETLPSIVLDPFLGSGTTIKAAIDNGRIGLGFEINPCYKEIIEKKIYGTPVGFEIKDVLDEIW
jgi:site-specific DNA-methyltransferase (cytosine-N4-specific)